MKCSYPLYSCIILFPYYIFHQLDRSGDLFPTRNRRACVPTKSKAHSSFIKSTHDEKVRGKEKSEQHQGCLLETFIILELSCTRHKESRWIDGINYSILNSMNVNPFKMLMSPTYGMNLTTVEGAVRDHS